MDRTTALGPDGRFRTADPDAALDRLGRFETMVEDLLNEQEILSAELASLREQGRTRSYQFREKMARKLNNNAVIVRLKQCQLL